MTDRIAVLGAGSWGMAVARLLERNDADVTLWEFDPDEYRKLVAHRTIPNKLKDFRLPESIHLSNDLYESVTGRGLLVLAIPSQSLRSVLTKLRGKTDPGVGLVNLAKGIETGTLKRMSEVIEDELRLGPERVATLSGPSHAEEVIRDMPTTVVAAGAGEEFIVELQRSFSGPAFRVYRSDDLTGVELGGSLKNIIAIVIDIALPP